MITDNDNFDVDTDDDVQDGNAAKTLRTQNKKLAKDLADLTAQLASFQQKERAGSLATHLSKLGAPAKAAKYAARDIEGDVTEEAVLTWLKAEGDMFGWTESDDDDDTADQAQLISQATSAAKSPVTGWTSERMNSASTADLIKAGIIHA